MNTFLTYLEIVLKFNIFIVFVIGIYQTRLKKALIILVFKVNQKTDQIFNTKSIRKEENIRLYIILKPKNHTRVISFVVLKTFSAFIYSWLVYLNSQCQYFSTKKIIIMVKIFSYFISKWKDCVSALKPLLSKKNLKSRIKVVFNGRGNKKNLCIKEVSGKNKSFCFYYSGFHEIITLKPT